MFLYVCNKNNNINISLLKKKNLQCSFTFLNLGTYLQNIRRNNTIQTKYLTFKINIIQVFGVLMFVLTYLY